MKKLTFTLIILCYITFYSFSQTIISNNQEVYGTWTKAKSPYIIDGEAIVPFGKTLTIEPGVTIKLKTGESNYYDKEGFDLGMLRVNGKLIAQGTENNWITFTRNGDEGMWGVVLVESDQDFLMTYCKFEYGSNIWETRTQSYNSSHGSLSLHYTTGIIENCIFSNCEFWNLFIANSKITVNQTTFSNSSYVCIYSHVSDVYIKNSILWTNNESTIGNTSSNYFINNSLIKDNEIKNQIEDKGKNIFEDNPEFIDENYSNYALKSNSICISAGENGIDIGAIPYNKNTNNNNNNILPNNTTNSKGSRSSESVKNKNK